MGGASIAHVIRPVPDVLGEELLGITIISSAQRTLLEPWWKFNGGHLPGQCGQGDAYSALPAEPKQAQRAKKTYILAL